MTTAWRHHKKFVAGTASKQGLFKKRKTYYKKPCRVPKSTLWWRKKNNLNESEDDTDYCDEYNEDSGNRNTGMWNSVDSYNWNDIGKNNVGGKSVGESDIEGNGVQWSNIEGNNVEGRSVEGSDFEGNIVKKMNVEGNSVEWSDVEENSVEERGNGVEGGDVEGNSVEESDVEGHNVEGSDVEKRVMLKGVM